MSYKIFMLIALPAIAIGWIAYAIWIRKVEAEEKKQPKPGSVKTKSELSDWAKQMAQFKKPTYKRPDEDDEDK